MGNYFQMWYFDVVFSGDRMRVFLEVYNVVQVEEVIDLVEKIFECVRLKIFNF